MNPKINILLVDDEARNLDVLESVLRSDEYNLVRVLTADDALLSLINGDFAAIVLDIQMPNMSGLELATLIKQRKRTRDIPIIFLTAYYQEDKDVLQGYGTGAVEYLTKPINSQILKSKVGVFVDLFRKTRMLSETNQVLEQEIARRQAAEEALREVNNDLERRVHERTADLIRVNAELREQEKELALARDRALAASRAKDDFVARLSHELRTPLNPVLLIATEAAANTELPPKVRSDFEKIADNVAFEARLIDDLLDVTRITQGKLTLDLRPLDFHATIHEVIAMERPMMTQKAIQLRLDLQAERHTVVGDGVRLRQVFWNVFKNAVKFTPSGGNISVETRDPSDRGRLYIRVIDTGIGMTPEEIEKMFDAFWQGAHKLPEEGHHFGGLGLGLAISRMLTDLHGGRIRAESLGPNKGATFTIELPLATPAQETPAAPTQVRENPEVTRALISPPRRRILLVEDHQPTSDVLSTLLARRNYDVTCAARLKDARAIARRERFDILISDIGLPDGSGCDLMNELRDRADMVGIALTGYGMEEDVNRCRAAGFTFHLTKPVRTQELDRALQAALATPQAASPVPPATA